MSARQKVAPHVYRDVWGYQVVIRRGGTYHSVRLPADSTPQDWHRAVADLLGAVGVAKPTRGSLRTDVERYMRQAQHLADPSSQRAHVGAFLPTLGDKERRRITRADVLELRSDWRAAGVSPKTCNNRLSALRALYHALDGPDAPTPADRIKPLPSHRTPPRVVSAEAIRAIDTALAARERAGLLRSPATRARFRILTTTGCRPSELMRAQPGDVDLKACVWQTRDGKGGYRPLGIPLIPAAVEGWRLFIQAEAWGVYDTCSFARTIRAAGWPADVRPYQARHSLGDALDAAGVDLADVALILGHTSPTMTRKHYVRARFSRMQAAMEKVAGRLTWD